MVTSTINEKTLLLVLQRPLDLAVADGFSLSLVVGASFIFIVLCFRVDENATVRVLEKSEGPTYQNVFRLRFAVLSEKSALMVRGSRFSTQNRAAPQTDAVMPISRKNPELTNEMDSSPIAAIKLTTLSSSFESYYIHQYSCRLKYYFCYQQNESRRFE